MCVDADEVWYDMTAAGLPLYRVLECALEKGSDHICWDGTVAGYKAGPIVRMWSAHGIG